MCLSFGWQKGSFESSFSFEDEEEELEREPSKESETTETNKENIPPAPFVDPLYLIFKQNIEKFSKIDPS